MKTHQSLTTGQASGMTGINLKTLQRYLSCYRKYFSPEAAQNKTGRRFTPEDVNKLLLIRRMYFEKKSPEDIQAALSGENIPQAAQLAPLEIISLVGSLIPRIEALERKEV